CLPRNSSLISLYDCGQNTGSLQESHCSTSDIPTGGMPGLLLLESRYALSDDDLGMANNTNAQKGHSAHTAQACRDHPKITSTCEATFSTRPGGRGRGRYRARPAAPCASGPPLEAFPARRNQNEDDVGRGRSRGSSDPGQS
ncbi:unnamed protein product, partial [Prorocentrum cordatum]